MLMPNSHQNAVLLQNFEAILGLNGAEFLIDSLFEGNPRETRTSHIHGDHDKVFVASQVVIPVKAPPLRHFLSSWSSITIEGDDGMSSKNNKNYSCLHSKDEGESVLLLFSKARRYQKFNSGTGWGLFEDIIVAHKLDFWLS